ncbi:MAG: hypothetical protein ACYTGH_02155 [Planctomycetota bacterium]|jgi:hypothetical protein
MRKRSGWVVLVVLMAVQARAADLEFLESFALAESREEALKTLIPGTEDYYYYHCLHAQNEKKPDTVESLLKLWIKRYGHSQRVKEIRNRQALLGYEQDHRKTLDFLRWRLGLHFNHQKRVLNPKTSHPTTLDPKLISRATLDRTARAQYRDTQGFEDDALWRLAQTSLDSTERRHLLSRLRRPDVPGLVNLIDVDLRTKHSRGFGSHPIHRKMLTDQLKSLLKKQPKLIHNQAFIDTMLACLAPSPDEDWEHDAGIRGAYLERLWTFAATLPASQSSLKANILFHRLEHARRQGQYPRPLFLEYIRYPRHQHYMNPSYLRKRHVRVQAVNLRTDFRRRTRLKAVGNDEPLLRDYLMTFFRTEPSFDAFLPFLRESYLKPLFAETKILAGVGDMEAWYSMMSPESVRRLKERVDLNFAPSNRTSFRAGDSVSLALDIKNVKELIVKVYEVNALNYYRDQRREVPLSINLDGLVANSETTHTYGEAPLRRVRRTFPFPQLKSRGVYVIEFIGNGKRSRALARKGALRMIERADTQGQVLQILTESNELVKGGAVLLNGIEYGADEAGRIRLPFTERPGRTPIVLRDGDFASLAFLDHRGEGYHLQAGVHIDREMLLRRETAKVLVRPSLTLNGQAMTVKRLKEVVLRIHAVDLDGISSTKEVVGFALKDDKDSVDELRTPKRLAALTVTLEAKVDHRIQAKPVLLKDERRFTFNGIDGTRRIAAIHLQRAQDGFSLYYLGKNGEALANRPLTLSLKHREYRRQPQVILQTDGAGRVALGQLTGIDRIMVRSTDGTQGSWSLVGDRRVFNRTIHAAAGAPISVPCMNGTGAQFPGAISILSTRGGGYGKDFGSAVKVKDGFLEVRDLPPGDYDLFLRQERVGMTLRVSRGNSQHAHVLGGHRVLKKANARPLQIGTAKVAGEELVIPMRNAGKRARIHVIASRFWPQVDPFASLTLPLFDPGLMRYYRPESFYEAGRAISDEYRYILNRRKARAFAGNMLTRPSLLLNPWSLRSTDARDQRGRGGEGYRSRHRGRSGERLLSTSAGGKGVARAGQTPNLDFLAHPAVLLSNLTVGKGGMVRVKLADLQGKNQIQVVAVDEVNTVVRSVALPASPLKRYDLRLAGAFKPEAHFAEQKRIAVLAKGESVSLGDVATADLETYDTLGSAYRLLATLNPDTTFAEFGFILTWPGLPAEKKRELYSKYACHELNLFLQRKDRAFFDAVVKPYLAHKKDKTFIDEYLLEKPLDHYLETWAYVRLNGAEQALLTERIASRRASVARGLKDRVDLIPPDADRFNTLFLTALKGREMEAGEGGALGRAKEEVKKDQLRRLARGRLTETTIDGPAPGKKGRGFVSGRSAPKPATAAAPMLAKAAKRKEMRVAADEAPAEEMELEETDSDDFADDDDDDDDAGPPRQLYRKLEKTREWAENNYYHQPLARMNRNLIPVNAFWSDYAAYVKRIGSGKGFVSAHLIRATANFAEMMLALAVTDLPFEAGKHTERVEGARYRLTAGGAALVFLKEIREAGEKIQNPVLISQNLFDASDRYRHEGNERIEKVVEGELRRRHVYGSQIVLTNPGAARQKLELLMQIPAGALPVAKGVATRSLPVRLEPFSTQTFELYFYFPETGTYGLFPAHAGRGAGLIASAEPRTLSVVDRPAVLDPNSWEYVSQFADEAALMAYLKRENLNRVPLARLAWRLKDRAAYEKLIALLESRHLYENTLWSYAILHDDAPRIRQYLGHQQGFVQTCGPRLTSPLLTIDPVARQTYQHLEYSPLVNPRAHRFGGKREILNPALARQYRALLTQLTATAQLSSSDRMAATYYLLLQDRIGEALALFATVKREEIAVGMQYDYCRAYLAICREDTEEALAASTPYLDHPVPRWRKRFRAVAAQVKESKGRMVTAVDGEDRTQRHEALARTQPSIDLAVEGRTLVIHYQNLTSVRVNYTLMDVELLFSTNPFVGERSGNFGHIRPNRTESVTLPKGETTLRHALPKALHSANMMIEVAGAGVRRSISCFAHELAVQVVESSGQVRVAHGKTGTALSKVYVKVYARLRDGTVRFFKDGYTDLRGRFDYASLNSDLPTQVERFSILLMSEKQGAVIKEAKPPLNNEADGPVPLPARDGDWW